MANSLEVVPRGVIFALGLRLDIMPSSPVGYRLDVFSKYFGTGRVFNSYQAVQLMEIRLTAHGGLQVA